MFFIGIFGIEDKENEIKMLNGINCRGCNRVTTARLIKRYTCFHFFFIPIFKWNEEYYVICNSCNDIFAIPKEKGKAIERGEYTEINYWDLKEQGNYGGNYYTIKRCPRCNRELENNFEFCPYCGEKLR